MLLIFYFATFFTKWYVRPRLAASNDLECKLIINFVEWPGDYYKKTKYVSGGEKNYHTSKVYIKIM